MPTVPPVPAARAATAIRSGLQRLTRRMVPGPIALLELSSGFIPAQAVYAAARLGIADILAAGPRPAAGVAAEAGADPDATYRLLRACASFGVFAEDADGRFRLTRLASGLRSGTADSVLPVVRMLGDPMYQGPWGQLTATVRTARPGAEMLYGKSMWDALDEQPAVAAIFNDAMSCLAALDWPTVAAVYDFSRFTTIVDVGGGYGDLLALMLDAAPQAKGVLLERPSLIAEAERHLLESGVLERCRLEPGSFFEGVPSDGDLYVMRRVLHDWDDGPAAEILSTVRGSMPAGARLLVLESVVPSGNAPHFAKALDLDMLVFVSGRERTEEQFRALLDRAGLRMVRTIPTISTLSLLEAVPEEDR